MPPPKPFAPPVLRLPQELSRLVRAALDKWNERDATQRLWKRDARLWTNTDEAKWLGWLDAPTALLTQRSKLREAADATKGFTHLVVLGMGGSSLWADVLARTFGRIPGQPALVVLDSTDPAQVRRVGSSIDVKTSLFLVASKLGATIETNHLFQHFLDRVIAEVGGADAGSRFIALTDPSSRLELLAKATQFRRVFHGTPSIPGGYSSLSPTGMLPAAASGIAVEAILRSAQAMSEACRELDPARNPGVSLGVALGVLTRFGRDKLTIVTSPEIATFGMWLEPLVANSTGKQGRAIVPVEGETLGEPEAYGTDRTFVYVRLASDPDPEQRAALDRLALAGHPVIGIDVAAPLDIGAEFFRWQIATVAAASLLGVNPFDRPDFEAGVSETRILLLEHETRGSIAEEAPIARAPGISLFADAANAAALEAAAGGELTVESAIRAHLGRLSANDYFALLLFVDMNLACEVAAQDIRETVRDARRVATCVGFGPRYLHATGQAHKGGPPSGVYLMVTCDDAEDVAIPGKDYTFGNLKSAQARGEFAMLSIRRRRALRVHLGADVRAGLRELSRLVTAAVS